MWNIDFEHAYDIRAGATEEQIARFVMEWNAGLSVQEMDEIKGRQVNPFHKSSPFYDQYVPLDPAGWILQAGSCLGETFPQAIWIY